MKKSDQSSLGAYRQATTLKKWNDRPQEGDPDEIIEHVSYFEADDTPVTDPDRIAEIERGIAGEEEDTCH